MGANVSMRVIQYSISHRDIWDGFVSQATNSTFLHYRSYIDYHSDRFIDHSLLFYTLDGKLYSILPANLAAGQLFSHQGLTYGGFLFLERCSFEKFKSTFEALLNYLKDKNIKSFTYKPIPSFYCDRSNEIEHYFMWRHGAEIAAMYLNSVISQKNKLKFSKNRIEGIKKFNRFGGAVVKSDNFREFWSNLTAELLGKYNTKPVHTVEEIELLKSRFQDNIELYVALDDKQKFLGGAVLYLSKNTVHVQYITSTIEGRAVGALDFLFDMLVNKIYPDFIFFDFGNSNEEGGRYLNRNLLFQKEGFGGEPQVQYVWRVDIEKMQIPEEFYT